MDQNKNTQGQRGQGQKQNQGQPNQGQRQGSQGNQDRDPAEGSREQTRGGQSSSDDDESSDNRGNVAGQERGTGRQGEKNSSGISNRGMSEREEQADLPSRGWSDESPLDPLDQSEDDSVDQSER